MMFTHYLEDSKNTSIPYINRILDNLKNNLLEASYKNNERAFHEILLFFRGQAFDSLKNSSLVYTQIVSIPAEIYPYVSKEYKKKIIEIFTIGFIESISVVNFYKKYDIKYLEISYWGFLKLIKRTIDENDYENFNLIFEKATESISFEVNKREGAEYYHHAFSFSVISWVFYLHHQNVINYVDYNLSYLEKMLQHNLFHNREKIINNFYRFENEATQGLFEVDNWELKESPVGVAYFALMSHTWLNFGFIIMLLKYNILNYGIKIDDISLNDKFKFILDSITKNLDIVNGNLEKWNTIIVKNFDSNKSLNDIFESKKEKILEFFTALDKRQDLIKYDDISKISLSEHKINEFKHDVGYLWDKNSFIPAILKHYNRVTYGKNIKEKKGFGFFQNLLKMRFAFIEGEHYQSVIGLTDFGSLTAKYVNEYFFNELLKLKTPKKVDDLSFEIDNFSSLIDDKSKIVIFTNWEGNEMLNKQGNLIKYTNEKAIPFSNVKYKELPIVNDRANSKFVFIVNFNTIKCVIYQDNSWYNKELLVEISEPSFDNIKKEIEKTEDYQERDGINYSQEEIEILEKNSIHLKVIFKFDLKILNKKGFEIFELP